METLEDKNQPKISDNSAFKFYCNCCDYGTSKKSNYDTHITSAKHTRVTEDYKRRQKSAENQPKLCQSIAEKSFVCSCGKEYKHRQGLWKHSSKGSCNYLPEKNNDISPQLIQLITELVKGQNGLQESILEIAKNGTTNPPF